MVATYSAEFAGDTASLLRHLTEAHEVLDVDPTEAVARHNHEHEVLSRPTSAIGGSTSTVTAAGPWCSASPPLAPVPDAGGHDAGGRGDAYSERPEQVAEPG
jgi:hypothetical protein